MSLTHVSSFHQLEYSLLAEDLHEVLVQSSFVDCTVSPKRSNWEKAEQRFHSPLPWTRFWMSVWSRVPYSHSLELPGLSNQENQLIYKISGDQIIESLFTIILTGSTKPEILLQRNMGWLNFSPLTKSCITKQLKNKAHKKAQKIWPTDLKIITKNRHA